MYIFHKSILGYNNETVLVDFFLLLKNIFSHVPEIFYISKISFALGSYDFLIRRNLQPNLWIIKKIITEIELYIKHGTISKLHEFMDIWQEQQAITKNIK